MVGYVGFVVGLMRFVGLVGCVALVRFVALVGFVDLVGFVGPVGFVGLMGLHNSEKIPKAVPLSVSAVCNSLWPTTDR